MGFFLFGTALVALVWANKQLQLAEPTLTWSARLRWMLTATIFIAAALFVGLVIFTSFLPETPWIHTEVLEIVSLSGPAPSTETPFKPPELSSNELFEPACGYGCGTGSDCTLTRRCTGRRGTSGSNPLQSHYNRGSRGGCPGFRWRLERRFSHPVRLASFCI
jgi:hypothetical protein